MSMPFITHSEITDSIYIVCAGNKYNVTEQVIKAMRETGRLEPQRPHGEWIETSNIWETEDLSGWGYWKECSSCHCQEKRRTAFCPNCGASMQANDRQVTGKLDEEPKDSHAEYWNSIGEWKEGEAEYKAKVKELEDAISKCEKAEKEFASRTCKFRSPTNCDFCAFHSDCKEHWKEGDEK